MHLLETSIIPWNTQQQQQNVILGQTNGNFNMPATVYHICKDDVTDKDLFNPKYDILFCKLLNVLQIILVKLYSIKFDLALLIIALPLLS